MDNSPIVHNNISSLIRMKCHLFKKITIVTFNDIFCVVFLIFSNPCPPTNTNLQSFDDHHLQVLKCFNGHMKIQWSYPWPYLISHPPTFGWLATILIYLRTPPTHYHLESSGHVAYMETCPKKKTVQSHDNLSRSYILPPNEKSMVDPRISEDRNTSMTGRLFQDTSDANIQVAWMRTSILVDSLQKTIPTVCTAGIYGHILIASSQLQMNQLSLRNDRLLTLKTAGKLWIILEEFIEYTSI